MKQMPSRLVKAGTFISVIPEMHYSESLIQILQSMENRALCFVTLNKPAASLEAGLVRFGISTQKIFFVDAVTGGLGKSQEKDNVLYLSSPEAFTELSIAVSEILRTGKFDALLFDSLSTLLIYADGYRAERFAASLIEKTKSTGSLGVYTCLEGDVQSSLIQRSCMHVDDIFMVEGKLSSQRLIRGSSAVVLLLGALFVGALVQGSGMTGASVAIPSQTVSSFAALLFVAALVPALIAGYLSYHTRHFRTLPVRTLRRFKTARVNAQQLHRIYRKKISAWVTNALHLF
ncbi:hypothetical protein HY497_00905 [Candidatus Woesearchaeota archaeon]|nr:hypothetical protein [Candidatus Woesearchaeota archaeon]